MDAESSKVYIKLHDAESGIILAMCDEALIDSVIEEGDVYINIKDYADFYKGSLIEKNSAMPIKNKNSIASANVVGNAAVQLAKEWGIISEDSINVAAGISYAQAYRIDLSAQQ